MVKKNKKVLKKSWKTDFVNLFEESLEYIKSVKNYIWVIIGFFFFSSIFAYFNSSSFSHFDELLRNIYLETEGLDFLQLTWFIFSNNVTSAISSLFLGSLFGIIPLFNALFNGSVLGYVYSKAVPIAGFGVIWRILPHGIFELPAIFISLGLGVHLGFSFFGRNKIKTFKERFSFSLKAFLVVVVPLLMLAAIIEGFLIYFIG